MKMLAKTQNNTFERVQFLLMFWEAVSPVLLKISKEFQRFFQNLKAL